MKRNPLHPVGNILVRAGDIVPFRALDQHNDFFTYISDHFEATYWLPGNHEYYHFDIAKKSGLLNENIRSNIWLVNNVSVVHQQTRLLFLRFGATSVKKTNGRLKKASMIFI